MCIRRGNTFRISFGVAVVDGEEAVRIVLEWKQGPKSESLQGSRSPWHLVRTEYEHLF